MIYVYAITDSASAAPLEMRGLDDAALIAHPAGEIAAIASAHELRQITPTPENLWRHEAVVESIMRQCDAVLPARFGTIFADQAALTEVLERHAEPLRAGLQRVRGCVELGLRVLWQPPLPEPSSSPQSSDSGRAYMQARLEDERRRREVRDRADRTAAELHDRLAPLARDSTRRVLPTVDVLMSSAYLVPRNAAESFAAAARALSSENPELRLLCTGPWPPYHFAPELAEVSHA
jgi:hypothetical protein